MFFLMGFTIKDFKKTIRTIDLFIIKKKGFYEKK